MKRSRVTLISSLAGGTLLLGATVAVWLRSSTQGPAGRAVVTFNRDVAPIIHRNCAPCHRPGQSAPFSLLTYSDVAKRSGQIADVTARRLMPPWLPDAGDGPFVGQRALSTEDLSRIQQWIEQGAPEGDNADRPVPPPWGDGWELGTADLVIRMTEPYALAADGPDLYRNFVIPIPTDRPRFVKGIELRPDNPRIVHHAFMRIDTTGDSRRRDAQEPGPGFAGLHTPAGAQTPPGQFLSWQPGKRHTFVPRGLAWLLATNADLVLQAHLRPSGKPETLQAAIGLHFTDETPTNTPFKAGLITFALDIPAGESNHVVRESYPLAADVELLSVLPHAHYLGRQLTAWAALPDGGRKTLLRIADWDFNWQGDYLFAQPVFLPKGTTIWMDYRYDNSTNNARNPHHPPQRVRYGLQSSDEMAELWLQLLPLRAGDHAALARYDQPRVLAGALAYNQYLLGMNPGDARAHTEIGKARLALGRPADAESSLRQAIALAPDDDEPHYFLGLCHRVQDQLAEAEQEFTAATRLNPGHAKAHGNLGLVRLQQGRLDEAEASLKMALRLNPQDAIARSALEDLARARGNR